jgi:murein DD-endopeptidase MepM/ murein hydrolase activator NlpD
MYEMLSGKLEAIKRKAEEALIELNNTTLRQEDDVYPGDMLPPFMDMSKVTIPWDNFGVFRRVVINGGARFIVHLGMDFSAQEGTDLLAPAWCVVTKIRKSKRGWGNYITLKITEGYWTGLYVTYCHCKDIKLKKGDEAKTGDVVAWVGSSGNSTGPHVHVMCSWLNRIYNSYKYRLEDCKIKGFIPPLVVFDILGALRAVRAKI